MQEMAKEVALVIQNKCPDSVFRTNANFNVSIGRRETPANTSVDIQVSDPSPSAAPSISQRHCHIRVQAGEKPAIILIPSLPTNGIFIAGSRGQWQQVDEATEVTLDTQIRLGAKLVAKVSGFFTAEQVEVLRRQMAR